MRRRITSSLFRCELSPKRGGGAPVLHTAQRHLQLLHSKQGSACSVSATNCERQSSPHRARPAGEQVRFKASLEGFTTARRSVRIALRRWLSRHGAGEEVGLRSALCGRNRRISSAPILRGSDEAGCTYCVSL